MSAPNVLHLDSVQLKGRTNGTVYFRLRDDHGSEDMERYIRASAVSSQMEDLHSELSSLRASLSRVTAERDEAIAKVQFMVNRAADEKLDGYRELGARAAAAENDRDEVLCLLDEAIECASHIETSEPDEAWGCWLKDLRARVAARKGE